MKDLKRKLILEAAVEEAKIVGFNHIQRAEVAARARVATGSINTYFKTMTQLKRDVMRYAVRHEVVEIILQGIACNDNHVKKLPIERRREICLTAINS